MIVPISVQRKYAEIDSFLEKTARFAREQILGFCEERGYAFKYRKKSLESISEKIETGRFKQWKELDDLIAFTVVIPTLREEKETIQYFRSAFDCIKQTTRGEKKKAPDVFRFDSTRMTCRLKGIPEEMLDRSYFSIYDVDFEVQICSAFEHAWSVTNHALTYKSDSIDWRRSRLASQIKATVEQLDTLILCFDTVAGEITKSDHSMTEDKNRIVETCHTWFERNLIPPELMPKDISRFAGNLYTLINKNGKGNTRQSIEEMNNLVQKQKRTDFLMSISLFQYITALLFEAGIIEDKSKDYVFPIFREVLDIFPGLAAVNHIFDFE